MIRHPLRGAGARARATFALLLGVVPAQASALTLLSEVFYDAVGSDVGQSFVELYGTPGTDLTGLVVEGINGSNGAVTDSVSLSGLIPGDGVFVVADDQGDGTTLVSHADLIARFDFQNGPDSVQLRAGEIVLDALAYGVFEDGEIFAGEGRPAPDAPAGSSLARRFADLDRDDNALDFEVLAVPTPGAVVLRPVPEPATAGMLLIGLSGLAVCGRRLR